MNTQKKNWSEALNYISRFRFDQASVFPVPKLSSTFQWCVRTQSINHFDISHLLVCITLNRKPLEQKKTQEIKYKPSTTWVSNIIYICYVCHIKFQFSFINFNLRILKRKKTLTWLCRYVVMPSAFASTVTHSILSLSLSLSHPLSSSPQPPKIQKKQIPDWWIFVKQSTWCYLLTDVSTSSPAPLSATLTMCECVYRTKLYWLGIADACQSFCNRKQFLSNHHSCVSIVYTNIQTHLTS